MKMASRPLIRGIVLVVGPIIFLPSIGSTYVLNPEPPGQRLTMTLNVGSFNQLAGRALAEWNGVGIGRVEDHDFFSALVDPTAAPLCSKDAVNVVAFSSTHCGMAWGDAIGVTSRWIVGGKTTQADVLFNANEAWDSYQGPLRSGVQDFYRVALHEFGHVIGLGHEDVEPSIMASRVGNIDRLQTDDMTGAHAILWGVINVALRSTVRSVTRGGTVPVTIELENVTAEAQPFGFLLLLNLPTGQRFPLMAPQPMGLPSQGKASPEITLGPIPSNAPLGKWTLTGVVFRQNGEPMDHSAIDFTVD